MFSLIGIQVQGLDEAFSGKTFFGAATNTNSELAPGKAVLSALNRSQQNRG